MTAFIQTCAWVTANQFLYSYWNGQIFFRDLDNANSSQIIEPVIIAHSGLFLLILRDHESPSLITFFEGHRLGIFRLIDGQFKLESQFQLPVHLTNPSAGLWSLHTPDSFYLGHENNIVSIWELSPTNYKLKQIIDLNQRATAPSCRIYKQVRALQLSATGKLYIAGESGIISIYDTTHDQLLLQHDYNIHSPLGMNDLCYSEECTLLWGTCCISAYQASQLYVWRIMRGNQVEITLLNNWHLSTSTTGYQYLNRCHALRLNSQWYLVVTAGDGTIRIARTELCKQSVDLLWIASLQLELEGGAEIALSPDGRKLLCGLQSPHILEVQALLSLSY